MGLKMRKIYKYDRYRGRHKMAQGAVITKATSREDALKRAHKLFDWDPQDRFVLREEVK